MPNTYCLHPSCIITKTLDTLKNVQKEIFCREYVSPLVVSIVGELEGMRGRDLVLRCVPIVCGIFLENRTGQHWKGYTCEDLCECLSQ